MTTTIDEPSTEPHDRRFEERLLDALLVELGAPAASTPSPGPIPIDRGRRQRVATWIGAAAAIALLAGATWVFSGGLDADEADVSVAGPPTTATPESGDITYLRFPDSAASTTFTTVTGIAGSFDDPEAVSATFRPTGTDRNRPLLTVTREDDYWHPRSGPPHTTPAGTIVYGSANWSTPNGPVAFAMWRDASGDIYSLRQAISSSASSQQLQLVGTDELLAFIDGLRLDGDSITQSLPGYDTTGGGADGDLGGRATVWALDWESAPSVDGLADTYHLSATRGATDLSALAGTPITVRGTTGVFGESSTILDARSALVWVEDGMTFTLTFSAKPDRAVPAEGMVTVADGLVKITRAEYQQLAGDARVELGPWSTVRFDLPETDATDLILNSVYLDADGNEVMSPQHVNMGGAARKFYDVVVPAGASTVTAWVGPALEPPACATTVDVSDPTPEQPLRATLDPNCS